MDNIDDEDNLVVNTNLSKIINLSIDDAFNERVSIGEAIKTMPLNTYGLSDASLFDQLNTPSMLSNIELHEFLNMCCKIIDYADGVHDFRSCNHYIESILGITGFPFPVNLCSQGSQFINVDNSHIIQEFFINSMISKLKENGISIPILEDSFFVPTEGIVKYLSSKDSPAMFYIESGRSSSIPEQAIQNKTICAIYDGCAHSGVSYSDVTNASKLESYTALNSGHVNLDISNYKLPFYGGMVVATFQPFSMKLKVEIVTTGHFIEIQLLNNTGITVNSIMTVFPILKQHFPKAERGEGNDDITFQIIDTNVQENSPEYIFLATCLKTVCDKIVSTEITPRPYIKDVVTIDGYVWAGITYKYLTGQYSILPTIYESVKNGWNVKPGIYNMTKEISDRLIRLIHLFVLFYGQESLPAPYNQYPINQGILLSYKNLIETYYVIGELCALIVKNLTVIDNIFDFLSCYKILANYTKINSKIHELRESVHNFFSAGTSDGNIMLNLLLQVPLLEDVLKNSSVDGAMKNQQTLIYTSDIVYSFTLTPEQDEYIKYFLSTYKEASQEFTKIIGNNGLCNTQILRRFYPSYGDNQIQDVCSAFVKARDINIEYSQISQPLSYHFDFFTGLVTGLVGVSIDDQLLQITFYLNEKLLKEHAKQNKVLVIDVKRSFTDSVYKLNDDDDAVYVVDTKNFTITGPLEMEILWILSVAIIRRPIQNTREGRLKEAEISQRNSAITYYGKILYNYLKPDIFSDDTQSDAFAQKFSEGIHAINIPELKNATYSTQWSDFLPNFDIYASDFERKIFSSELPGLNGEEIKSKYDSTVAKLSNNVSLPGDEKLGGFNKGKGKINALKTRHKKYKQGRIKSKKNKKGVKRNM